AEAVHSLLGSDRVDAPGDELSADSVPGQEIPQFAALRFELLLRNDGLGADHAGLRRGQRQGAAQEERADVGGEPAMEASPERHGSSCRWICSAYIDGRRQRTRI